MENEVWKDIPNYEGLYQASNLGNIKSLPKKWISGKNLIKQHNGCLIKQRVPKSISYYVVSLRLNNKAKTYTVHQLVAMAFLNHIPCGHKLVVDHINNDKLDNRAENLQIVTSRFNLNKSTTSSLNLPKNIKKNRYGFRVVFGINGKKDIGFGTFKTIDEAVKVADEVRIKYDLY